MQCFFRGQDQDFYIAICRGGYLAGEAESGAQHCELAGFCRKRRGLHQRREPCFRDSGIQRKPVARGGV